ncbi:hypothetical protein LMG8520_2401 [Lactococcus lactis subsp. lactis]|uniref:Uncharacterized protein n=1 Tax=Lactococcus lactis subsp. lactis TaxID=1360 RepID=A0A0V8CX20_LACLL|nr:hypothetical protein LMG8520_2401 [Lactococcus lactis subsp. lactis]
MSSQSKGILKFVVKVYLYILIVAVATIMTSARFGFLVGIIVTTIHFLLDMNSWSGS